MTDEIKALMHTMQDAADESFYACERFGKGSVQHLSLMAAYREAKDCYEAACKTARIDAYATYDID